MEGRNRKGKGGEDGKGQRKEEEGKGKDGKGKREGKERKRREEVKGSPEKTAKTAIF